MWPVDVRDTADGHIRLLSSSEVRSGERFLLWSTKKLLMEDLVAATLELFPNSGFDPTAEAVDELADEVKANEDFYVKLWAGVQLRNDGARRVGTHFRPFTDTLRDTTESLIDVCGVEPRLRAQL